MKHRVGYNRLGRKPSHRKALHRNMVTSLFKHERIRTTKAKAQAIRRTAEKMITRAKIDSVHNRRIVAKDVHDKAVLAKLFVEIAPRFKERPGGYTRVLKIGPRPGDAAEMVLLELVGEMAEKLEAKSKKKSESESKPEKTRKKTASKPKAKAEPETDATPAEDSGDAKAEDATETTAKEAQNPKEESVDDEKDNA